MRTVILVRHGLYDENDPRDPEVGRLLTDKGREQARLTAQRLAGLPVKVNAIYGSSMMRARQTAEILGKSLHLTPVISRELRECTPPTERADVMARQAPGSADSCEDRLEGVWKRWMRPSPLRDSVEVVVCHGNVIRWLVARAIGLDPRRWLNLTIGNCSLSEIRIYPDGRIRLVSFDDVGHLPASLQAYPVPAWDPGPTPRPAR